MTPTPDLSEFRQLSSRHPERCVVGRSADALSTEDQAKFKAALTAVDIGHETIAKWLKAKGLDGRFDAVRRHRAGGCCCV